MLGNLSNLEYLNLSFNQLSGEIPTELGNLTNLTWLGLGSNQLSGSIPPELGNLSNLTELYLYDNQLSGSIPSELGNLSNLTELYLNDNQLNGSIPAFLGSLSSLQELSLFSNQLSGSIPSELGNLSNLTKLYLNDNQLSGSIPASLGSLSSLQELTLFSNQLSGNIPSELGNLSNLTKLYLNNNQLSDGIPSTLNNLTNISDSLTIRSNNYTFNELEPFLGSTSLNVSYVPQNKVGTEQTHYLQVGDSITLTAEVSENPTGHDNYQWYKDGQAISGATSRSYTISNFSSSDAGVYTYKITNSVVSDLTLESENITLIEGEDPNGGNDNNNDTTLPKTSIGILSTIAEPLFKVFVGIFFIMLGLLFYRKDIEFY